MVGVGLNVKEKPALLGSREGWEQVFVTGKVSIQSDWVGLTPPFGILQSLVALISLTPCFTSLQPPGPLRNLLMRSNYEKCQGFNQLWMHGWRVQLNLPRGCTLNTICCGLQNRFPCCSPISVLQALPHHSWHPHYPLFLSFLPLPMLSHSRGFQLPSTPPHVLKLQDKQKAEDL